MSVENKRGSDRKDTLNLLDYVVIDEHGTKKERAMARTLNVSEKGILVETHIRFEKGQELLITIGLKNELFEVRGRVAHTEDCGLEAFCSGVEFFEVKPDELIILRKFLEAFNKQQQERQSSD
ncbi:MAG: PilZ domain-containing protein [Proteobacteria bacterium]|nr:PilZ domain-containing protein [Pseudomonadota bacterium]MBU1685775.1 PilZ domain-containing protein [Pseudomonadota bacterium]